MKRNGLLYHPVVSGVGGRMLNFGLRQFRGQQRIIKLSIDFCSIFHGISQCRFLVRAGSVEDNLSNPDLLVIDARGKAAYDQGHIPGAINLIHNDFWTWGSGLEPVEELEAFLGEAGLTRDMTVVVYDNTTAAWGAAGRIFWMLNTSDATTPYILNGGWDKWIADGRSTEQEPTP